jgi:N-acetylglucosamine-6-sulfatase
MARFLPRVVAAFTVAGLAAMSIGSPTSSAGAQAVRPNIVFVLTDDLDAAELAFMPKVKALLADQGASFSNYFVNVSLCCPSRATMLRGQYAHNTGVMTNNGTTGGFETAFARGLEKSTFATWLQAGGYRTAFYGKYLNGYPETAPSMYIPPGWTDWASAIGGNPYGEFNYQLNENGRAARYRNAATDYGTDVYTGKAVAFIRKAVADQTPFLVHLSVYAPHLPATPAPRHAALFGNARAPRTASFNEDDVSDKPAFIRNRPRIQQRGQDLLDEYYRDRLRSLQAVDEAVEALVNLLQSTGQTDRTFIVFASDNGFHLGQHRLQAGKQTAYEEDIHVPLIVRGPNVPAGRKVSQLAGNVDLAPTFAEMAGVAVPSFVDGRSLMPLLGKAQPPNEWRSAYLIGHWLESAAGTASETAEPRDADQTPDPDPAGRGRRAARAGGAGRAGGPLPAQPAFQGIRTTQYTYVEYASGERELYDVGKDPNQLNNIASKASASLLQSLAAQLAKLKSCAGANCR